MALKQISIEREYEKNPDINPEDIKKLRDWLGTQPHLPGDLLSDVDLLVAYHCCESRMEVTQQLIDLHFTTRTTMTDIFKHRTVDQHVEFGLDKTLHCVMPVMTVDGYRAMYVKILDVDPKAFIFSNIVRTFMFVFDLLQHEEGTWPGCILMIDFEGTNLSHLMRIDIMTLKNMLYFVQECMFIKLKEVCFLNSPSFIDKLMIMMRPFLNKSLLDIINCYPVGSDKIHQKIPKEAFPKEFGGEYKDEKTIKSEMLQRLKANEDFFKFENKRKVDESKRPGNSKKMNIFIKQESFKKLDID